MGAEQSKPKGPDFARGVPIGDVADGGMVGGHVGDDAVLLARHGDELFAIGSTCSHYGGPLADGLIVGDTVRCPWHPSQCSFPDIQGGASSSRCLVAGRPHGRSRRVRSNPTGCAGSQC